MPQNANARTTLNDEEPPLPAEEREGGFGVRGKEGESTKVYPAVLSIGFNPYYGNETRSIVRLSPAIFPFSALTKTPYSLAPNTLLSRTGLVFPSNSTHTLPLDIPHTAPFSYRTTLSPPLPILPLPSFHLLLTSPPQEIHILHPFSRFNFYHSPLNLLILGFIRQEENYDSLDALVEDIKTDCDVARASLDRIAYQKYKAEQWLKEFEWVDSVDVEKIERETVGDGEPKNAGDGNVIGEKGGEKGGEDGG